MSSKIQVGSGDKRKGGKYGQYGGKKRGKFNYDAGGFGVEPTMKPLDISQERFDDIFPSGYKPKWLREETYEKSM